MKALDPKSTNTVLEVDSSLLKTADQLQKQLENRLLRHLQVRVKTEQKRNHWAWKWLQKNFPPTAATMVLFNHIKQDISCLDHNQCLLDSVSSFLKATANCEASMEGCYIYYDFNNQEWIRSGKAVGESSNFGARDSQHAKGSKLETTQDRRSNFYNSYASNSVELADNGLRRGKFENLQMFVGIGFHKLLKGKLTHDLEDGGIFHFDKQTKKSIDGVKFSGNQRLQQKQLHMLGYLWELVYDLCIAPSANISTNPGFESVVGQF